MKDLARRILEAVNRRCADERGVALIVAAGSMVALTSAVALAVDVGMLTVARTEAQAVADGAAMAGAAVLIPSPQNAEWAREEAMDFAGLNRIRGRNAQVLEEDVAVDLAARTVSVLVLRTEERGNPIGTFFARVFGVNSVDITAFAVARASNAGGINCLLPLAVPDNWFEAGGAGNDPDTFNPEYGDEYRPWMDTSTDPPTYNESGDATGYSEANIGDQIVLTINDGGGFYHEGWYHGWRPPGQSGADDFEENIQGCVDPSITYYIGQTVITEQGNQVGKTSSGFRNLIDQDVDAAWNENLDCVTDVAYVLSQDSGHCRSSPRVRPIPMFDPTNGPDNGAKPFELTNFAGVFVEEIQGSGNNSQFIARFMGYQGLDPAAPDASTNLGPLFKVIQLIE